MPKNIDRQQVLAAVAECDTFTAAADAAGISRKTLFNYMKTDRDFAAAVRLQWDYKALERADAARADQQAAFGALRAILDDVNQPGAVRIKAAATIIEHTEKAIEAGKVAAQNAVNGHNPLRLSFE